MIKEIMLNPLVISGGVGIILLIIGKIVDDKKLRGMGLRHGKFVSRFMGGRMGKRGWEKVERFLQRSGLAYFKGLWEGLDEDDKKKG